MPTAVEFRNEQRLTIVLEAVETLSFHVSMRRLYLKIFLNRTGGRFLASRIAVGIGNDFLAAGQTDKVLIDEGRAGGGWTYVGGHGRRLEMTERKVEGRTLREIGRVALGTGRIQWISMVEGVSRCPGC